MLTRERNVPKAVVVKSAHCTELDGEYLALSVLNLFDLVLDVLGNELFGSEQLGILVLRSPVLRSSARIQVSIELP
jgi:hypothetical protein